MIQKMVILGEASLEIALDQMRLSVFLELDAVISMFEHCGADTVSMLVTNNIIMYC